MAYADQNMSGSRMTALVVTGVIHLALGYALVTGLAYSAAKQMLAKVTTIDVKEEEKKPPPPPKPKDLPPPPPIVAPPPRVNVSVTPPQIQTVAKPPPAPPPIFIAPPAPVPPPPRTPPKPPVPKGSPANWATTSDYPSRALREEKQGVTGFRVSVGPDGRVSDCSVTSSSGSDELDAATCTNVTRRARFVPAVDSSGNATSGSYSNRIRWVIPRE